MQVCFWWLLFDRSWYYDFAVSRACAAADVADAPNSVVTCEAAGCNGIAWSELGNDTKRK